MFCILGNARHAGMTAMVTGIMASGIPFIMVMERDPLSITPPHRGVGAQAIVHIIVAVEGNQIRHLAALAPRPCHRIVPVRPLRTLADRSMPHLADQSIHHFKDDEAN